MAKAKESSKKDNADIAKPQAETSENNSDTTRQAQTHEKTEPSLRIIFRGSCPKLPPEEKVHWAMNSVSTTIPMNHTCVIAGNASSGAFSTSWIAIDEIHTILKIQKNIHSRQSYCGNCMQANQATIMAFWLQY